mmetsp:Transcript_11034/g.40823  ORF Transcript_11034/g.40823 Transcript_11034/m.40823 type:complete len:270 (-) Transcript_11034:1736-2545(-)
MSKLVSPLVMRSAFRAAVLACFFAANSTASSCSRNRRRARTSMLFNFSSRFVFSKSSFPTAASAASASAFSLSNDLRRSFSTFSLAACAAIASSASRCSFSQLVRLSATVSRSICTAFEFSPSFKTFRRSALSAPSSSFFAARASLTSFFTALSAWPTLACAFRNSTRAASASRSSFSRATNCCTNFFSSAASASKISCALFFFLCSLACSAAKENTDPSSEFFASKSTSSRVAFSFRKRFLSVISAGRYAPVDAPATSASLSNSSPAI